MEGHFCSTRAEVEPQPLEGWNIFFPTSEYMVVLSHSYACYMLLSYMLLVAYSVCSFEKSWLMKKQHSSVTPWPRLKSVHVECDGRLRPGMGLEFMAIEWGRWWWTGGFWELSQLSKAGQRDVPLVLELLKRLPEVLVCLVQKITRSCLIQKYKHIKNGVYGDFTNKNGI